MKNSPSRFDNLWLFYLGEPAVPRLVGELRYLQLTRSVSLTYAWECQPRKNFSIV